MCKLLVAWLRAGVHGVTTESGSGQLAPDALLAQIRKIAVLGDCSPADASAPPAANPAADHPPGRDRSVRRPWGPGEDA
jgi:hypothetical protein